MKSYIVIGLGRFGTEVARRLCQLGCEVLAVDTSDELVQAISNDVTNAVVADARDSGNKPLWRLLCAPRLPTITATAQPRVDTHGADARAAVAAVLSGLRAGICRALASVSLLMRQGLPQHQLRARGLRQRRRRGLFGPTTSLCTMATEGTGQAQDISLIY